MVILKTYPGISKHDGGIKMWMWLCLERELFSIWKQSRNEEDKKKHCEAKNDCMFLSRYVRVSEGIHTLLYSCLNVKKHFAPSRCEI